MADELVFLQPTELVDPPLGGFSPGSRATASVPCAVNLEFLQFPVLESSVRHPEARVAVHRNPERHSRFLGGIAEESLSEALDLDDSQAEQLTMLLSETASPPPDRHIEAGGRIRYFGQACLVLQTPEGAVVTDPFISAGNDARDRYTLDDLPDFIDLMLVTHGHQDHILLQTLLQLRGRIGMIVAPRCSRRDPEDSSIGLYLSRLGFPVVEADDYDEFTFPGGKVVATPFLDEHGDPDIRGESTYWVELAGRSAFIAADSSGIDPAPYRYIRQSLGTADYAFLGMERDGAWRHHAVLPQLVTRRMSNSRKRAGSNAEQAAIMTELEVGEAYVYAMGEEPWPGHLMADGHDQDTYKLKQIDEFISWCADHRIKAGHLIGQQEYRW